MGIGDVDQDSTSLEDLLSEIRDRPLAGIVGSEDEPGKLISVSELTSRALPSSLYTFSDGALSLTYDALVASWITSLAPTMPGRIRSRSEKLVRSVVAQLQLASYGLRLRSQQDQPEHEPETLSRERQATFTLPVRGLSTVADDSGRFRAEDLEQAPSQPASSSQISEDAGFMPAENLPTPAPTPSLRSQDSQSTLGEAEDSAVQRLRAFTNVSAQPPLPSTLMGILSHWSIGQNPDNYDWEVSKSRFERADEPDAVEGAAQAKKRRRIERLAKRRMENTAGSSQNAPVRFPASQDDVPDLLQFSSQQAPLVASQPEPSRYGRRTTAKKQTKKPGFRN